MEIKVKKSVSRYGVAYDVYNSNNDLLGQVGQVSASLNRKIGWSYKKESESYNNRIHPTASKAIQALLKRYKITEYSIKVI